MSSQNKKRPPNRYLVLTGIAFQMGAIIYLAAYLGKKMDNSINPEQKTYTLIITLVGLVIAIWLVLKQVKRLN